MIKLFTIRHGSHLYGTQNELSDIDLKTIFLPDIDDLLIGKKMEIFKDRDVGPNECTKANDIEEEFIPLQIFASHFLGSQSYALEVAFAYQQGLVEWVNEDFEGLINQFMTDLTNKFLTKSISTIIGYAYSQAQKYSNKGSRLNEIDCLIGVVELAFDKNKKATIFDVSEWYDKDINQPIFICTIPATRANEAQSALSIGNKTFAFNTTLKHFLKGLNILKEKYGERSKQSLDGHDWKAMAHAIRIANQGIELLSTGRIVFPRPDAEFLKAIRRGEYTEEVVNGVISSMFVDLKTAQVNSILPELSEELKVVFSNWLKGQMKLFYCIGYY